MSAPAPDLALPPDPSAPPFVAAPSRFGEALLARRAELVRSDGRTVPLDVRRWRAAAAGEDGWLLARCRGMTIDLGCGPGRLVAALLRNGVAALGVDLAVEAVRQCRRRGVPVLRADVLGPLPGVGRWSHALLADGNLGIGGDPVALLRRAADLLAPGGTVLVELDPDEDALWRGSARVRSARADGLPFAWAVAGPSAIPDLAARAGLRVLAQHRGRRAFAELGGSRRRATPTRGGGASIDVARGSRSREPRSGDTDDTTCATTASTSS
jgi:SAM-dependent methyltransferase